MSQNRFNPNEEAFKNHLAAIEAAPGLTCGTCRHWDPVPPNPNALGERRGLCLERPPAATTTIVQDRFGNQGTMVQCNYPNLPADYKACHQHDPRLEV